MLLEKHVMKKYLCPTLDLEKGGTFLPTFIKPNKHQTSDICDLLNIIIRTRGPNAVQMTFLRSKTTLIIPKLNYFKCYIALSIKIQKF